MHKLILLSAFLSAADVKKTGSDALHEPWAVDSQDNWEEPTKYLFAKMIRWHSNFTVTPEDCYMSPSAVEVTTDFTHNGNVCIKHVVFIAFWMSRTVHAVHQPVYLIYLL